MASGAAWYVKLCEVLVDWTNKHLSGLPLAACCRSTPASLPCRIESPGFAAAYRVLLAKGSFELQDAGGVFIASTVCTSSGQATATGLLCGYDKPAKPDLEPWCAHTVSQGLCTFQVCSVEHQRGMHECAACSINAVFDRCSRQVL